MIKRYSSEGLVREASPNEEGLFGLRYKSPAVEPRKTSLRERLAAWLCAPLLDRLLGVMETQRELITSHGRLLDKEQEEIIGLKLLCEGLAADLNSTLGELRSQRADNSNQPRVRVARNFSAFSEAATIAARKGAKQNG